MNLPEIYESDYFDAVQRIHQLQSPVKNPIYSVSCRTVKGHRSAIQTDYMGSVSGDFATLDFIASRPSFTTGLRFWSLKTKIILVPDENTTNG